jgi:hypothetical protein
MQRSTRFTAGALAIALAVFVTSFAVNTTALSSVALAKEAQGPPQAPPAAGTPPKPLVPVAASSVANNPDPYVNEYVTMTATVEANLSKTSFSVDQDKTKSTGKEVLVLAPSLQKPADANAYVTVIGQLIKFDEKDVAAKLKDYQLDLSAADIARFKGKPVVLATAVINNSGIDIAKKPIPPMTADDLVLQKIMTKLPPAQGAVRKSLDSKDMAGAKEQATILKGAFTEIEAFFKTKNNQEALKWAGEGKNHAEAILVNLGLNNIEAAKTSITPLGSTCASCHGKYRERMEDGTFRIKG